MVCTITDAANDYAREVFKNLRDAGIRAEFDIRNEKINYKVREHSQAKVPVLLVVGAKEIEEGTVAMRRLGGKSQEVLALSEALDTLKIECSSPLSANSNPQSS